MAMILTHASIRLRSAVCAVEEFNLNMGDNKKAVAQVRRHAGEGANAGSWVEIV